MDNELVLKGAGGGGGGGADLGGLGAEDVLVSLALNGEELAEVGLAELEVVLLGRPAIAG